MMEVHKEIKNDLLKRQELVLSVEAEKNPGFDEVKKEIAKKFSKPEETINVHNIKGSFGSKVFEIHAEIYDSKEGLEKAVYLRKSKKQKEADAKAKEEAVAAEKEPEKTEEAPAEEAPEENPAEETKEEPKEEKAEEKPKEEAAESPTEEPKEESEN